MKSMQMKALALAVLGLAGFGVAGSAMACDATNLAAWNGGVAAITGGTVTAVAPGLDASACAMSSSLGTGATSQASVIDTSPNNEPRYRFQFLVDPNAHVTNLTAQDSVALFTATNQTAAHGRKTIIQVFLVPTSTAGIDRISFSYSCNNGTTYRCIHTSPVNLVSGVNRIEFDVQMATSGANGSIRYWINAPAGGTEPAPSDSVTGIDNSAWVGTKLASLGLGTPAPHWSSAHHGEAVLFDTFDSRRQTYIGH